MQASSIMVGLAWDHARPLRTGSMLRRRRSKGLVRGSKMSGDAQEMDDDVPDECMPMARLQSTSTFDKAAGAT